MIAVNVAALQHQVFIFCLKLRIFPDLLTSLIDNE